MRNLALSTCQPVMPVSASQELRESKGLVIVTPNVIS